MKRYSVCCFESIRVFSTYWVYARSKSEAVSLVTDRIVDRGNLVSQDFVNYLGDMEVDKVTRLDAASPGTGRGK